MAKNKDKKVVKSDKIEKSAKPKKIKGTTYNLHDFGKAIAAEVGEISAGQTHKVLQSFCTSVKDTVLNGNLSPGDKISLPGVGLILAVQKRARQARNPRTGETFMVPERPAVKFKLAAHLRLWGKPEKKATAPAAAKKLKK